jgi:hypothetical protein
VVAPEGLLFLMLSFRFGRAEEFVLGATVGVAFAVAVMALLTVEVLISVGVDMVGWGNWWCWVVWLCVGCSCLSWVMGVFGWLKVLAGSGDFREAGEGDVALVWVGWVELGMVVWAVVGQGWGGCVGLRVTRDVRSWFGLRGGCGCWA